MTQPDRTHRNSLGALIVAGLIVASCDATPAPTQTVGEKFKVVVERVSLNAVYLPEALVTVTNLTDDAFHMVTVSCRFLDKTGALIDVGEGQIWDVGPHAEVSDEAVSTAQYQKPSSAECRVDYAR